MSEHFRPATIDVARYTLAINDMRDVSKVAQLIADHDPDLAFFKRMKEVGVQQARAEASARPADRYQLLGDFHLRLVIETGLIVTYARPFTRGDGSGFPLSQKVFVPRDALALHREMLVLRKQVHAHIDATGPEGFRRTVEQSVRSDAPSVHSSGPRRLGPDQLRDLGDLADAVIERLEAARSEAQARP